MSEADLILFRKHTGRQRAREEGYPEAVCIVGRQSGKSAVAAVTCAFEAATSRDPGTYALLISQDARAAQRVLFGYARETFRASQVLAREVVGERTDSLELATGTTLACYPCRPQAVRGVRARVACLDELAFFRSSEGYPTDREMLRALRPTVATTGGRLLILSSPYGQSGALWDLHARHYGQEESGVLVWQATAPAMNPTLPADYLARMARDDPEAYRSEVLGEFRSGTASLFDPEALDEVVATGVREHPPADGMEYTGFVDPSGGRADAFTLALAHQEARVVVDLVRAWHPPFNPTGVVEEVAQLLRRYRVREVGGDRYGGEWPREAFRAEGIRYEVAEQPKSDLYLELLATVNSRSVEVPDLPALLRELRGLERRRGPSGRDRVDHRPGSHDDLANAVAGVVSAVAADRRCPRAAFAVA
jgi:hypothetical protein